MTPENEKIFSGDDSVEMWKEIRKANTKKKLRWALFDVCCKLQELESRIGKRQGGKT